jgi:hypothetical protein
VIVDCGAGELRLGDGPFKNCVGSPGVIYGMVVFVVVFERGICRCGLGSIVSSPFMKRGLS